MRVCLCMHVRVLRNRSPDSFPGLGAPGLDLPRCGPGQIPQRILIKGGSTGTFPGMGAAGLTSIVYRLVSDCSAICSEVRRNISVRCTMA